MPKQTPVYNSHYDMEYFAGSAVSIYIGDVWVDDINYIGFNVGQQKTPVYGYASQLYDALSAGQVIAQGEFSINFKEAGYLWAVLRRYLELGHSPFLFRKKNRIDPLSKKQAQLLSIGKQKKPIVGRNGTLVSRANIERLIQGDATTKDKYQFYHDLAGYATASNDDPQDKRFEDIVEAFEDQLWDGGNQDNDLIRQLRRTDDNMFDEFNLYIVYGNYSNPNANHTSIALLDVSLTSRGQTVQADGSPIQEVYRFIGKTQV